MTTEMSSNETIIGRKELDDLEAILAVVGTEESDGRHVVSSEYDSIFTWDYEKGSRPKLNKLYEKAKGCLLYTSPSPRDGLLSRMPSSA